VRSNQLSYRPVLAAPPPAHDLAASSAAALSKSSFVLKKGFRGHRLNMLDD